jgi:hypothetical protein
MAELELEFIDCPSDDELPDMVKNVQAHGRTIDIKCEFDSRIVEASMVSMCVQETSTSLVYIGLLYVLPKVMACTLPGLPHR